MNNYQIIFSPTGGTEKVANAITQTWSQVNTIDLSVPDINYKDISFESDSLVLIAMPSCGQCALKCPASAISTENLKVSNKSKCISCMRCVSICPVHARKVSSLMTSIAATAIKKACSVEKANELFV